MQTSYKDVGLRHTDQAAKLLSQGICLVTGVPEYQKRLRNNFDMHNWHTCFYGTAFAIANKGLANPYYGAENWADDSPKGEAVRRMFYWTSATDEQVVRIYKSISEEGVIEQANSDWSDTHIVSMRFSFANFSGANFRKTYFEEAAFIHSDLSGADFTDANVSMTRFAQTDLTGAIFGKADVEACQFDHCNLSGVDLSQVKNADLAYWYACVYDENTKFPAHFDPTNHGMYTL
jgi:hypothetical protein